MATPQLRPPAPALVCAAGMLSLAAAMGIGRFAFTPLLPLMIRAGQIDVGAAGWLAAANYLGYLVGALSAARLPVGARALALLALAVTASSTAAMAGPGGLAAWLALRFIAGVASAWVFVATAVWCLGALAQAGRPALAGAVYAGVGAGIALAGLYCLAGSAQGLAAATLWLQLGAVALLLGVLVAGVVLRLPERARPAPSMATAGAQGSRSLVVCYGLFGFGYILPATFLPLLARSVADDPRLFGWAWPVFGATAALSTLAAASCMQRFSRVRVWAVSQLLMGVGVLLPSIWLNGLTVALSALLVGGTFMVITMAGVQEVRARVAGDATRLIGHMTAAFALGQIAGPAFSSLLVREVGARGLPLALQTGAAGLLLSACWLWQLSILPETRKDVPHASR